MLHIDLGLKELMYLYELLSDDNYFFFHVHSLLRYMVTTIENDNESRRNIDMLKMVSASGDVDVFPPRLLLNLYPSFSLRAIAQSWQK